MCLNLIFPAFWKILSDIVFLDDDEASTSDVASSHSSPNQQAMPPPPTVPSAIYQQWSSGKCHTHSCHS